ncbi:MAG TPA: winged helix-turn-helix domain-containing protein [Candidatus Dormibacteraeota bacterium]|jgi:DNA-binding winged helix-turn-helix (wHTH) protein|nr:winged helix-turn-helix domain-containing protein [Candidatus Dormibacteraeota bacterium]
MTSNLLPAVGPLMETSTNAELAQSPRYIRFGSFQIDQQRQQVFRNGTRLKLQGKVYQVLLALIAKHGQVVTREELKQALWPSDTHVNFDANVNTTVNKLRQILGDSTDKPIYIETIPRKGYSFMLEPEFGAQPFPQSLIAAVNGNEAHSTPLDVQKPKRNSDRWLTLGVIALILAGILLGAGVATLWISHSSSILRH